jgi:hypothetical protein
MTARQQFAAKLTIVKQESADPAGPTDIANRHHAG